MRTRSTDPAGRVLVRPMGLVVPSTVKRYQRVAPEGRVSTSTCAVWSLAAAVVSVPAARIVPGPKEGSVPISHPTVTPDPAVAGSTLVHRTTPPVVGSPDSTPEGKVATGR